MRGIALKEHEEILVVVYQSLFLYLRSFIVAVGALVATSYFLFWLLEQGLWGQIAVGAGYSLGVLLLIRLGIFWRGTKMVITNRRVFDIYQRSLFDRQTTQVRLKDIDEVEGEITGFWGTILRLGKLRIEAKRGEVVVSLPWIRRVYQLEDLVLDQLEVLEQGALMEKIGDDEVLAYMETLDVPALNQLIRKSMAILQKKKEE